jgi:hypothetical protein
MEAGVHFFDTADVYWQGLSEEILEEAIKHLPRESFLLPTKATFQFGDGPHNAGSRKGFVARAATVEAATLRVNRHGFQSPIVVFHIGVYQFVSKGEKSNDRYRIKSSLLRQASARSTSKDVRLRPELLHNA